MLDALRSFFDDMTGPARSPEGFASDDPRLAAVALLVHLANADGVLDPSERLRLEQLVEQRYALEPSQARRLIAQASADEREAVDLFHFTHVLKRNLDAAGRQAVVEALWDMAYADGQLHEFEENIIARIAELLGVSPRERVALKQRAEQGASQEVPQGQGMGARPWGGRGGA